jgi:hypothetical protein
VIRVHNLIDGLSRAGIWRHTLTPACALALLPVALLVADLLTPPEISLGPLMVAAPGIAAIFCGPAGVLLVVAVTLPCAVLASQSDLLLGSENFVIQIGAIALISAFAVAASVLRVRRERQLAQSRWVAEVTQRVLLHPLPRRVGRFDLSSLYLAADEEAAIGGDLYAVSHDGDSVRILLGDAQGKGLASLEMVSSVLNSFRQSTRNGNALSQVVCELEEAFHEDVRELSAAAAPGHSGPDNSYEEAFVTAVVVDLPDDGPIHLANLGHPPPLIVHQGAVTALEPTMAVPPLGLGELNGGKVAVDTVDFPPGATLLLYTDGVTEARDRAGDFYPLADRLSHWTALPPDALLAAVRDDLRQHVGARLVDDVAMVAVHRAPARVPSGRHSEALAPSRKAA